MIKNTSVDEMFQKEEAEHPALHHPVWIHSLGIAKSDSS